MKHTVLIFSAIAASLLILLNLRKLSVQYGTEHQEIWTAVFAVIFIVTGILVSRLLRHPGAPAVGNSEETDPAKTLANPGLTQREYEVLKLVAAGDSNLEISQKLFISESTVKTHVSSMLSKLDAKRRTQAVQRAKELNLL